MHLFWEAADTARMITSAVLVLPMTLPGIAVFYGNMVRRKSLVNVMRLAVLRQCGAIAGASLNPGLLMLTLAVAKELGLDISKLNINGGARYGISSACVGGGQDIALLLKNHKMSKIDREMPLLKVIYSCSLIKTGVGSY